jgi:effector-binding domain-containing protein
MANKKGLARGHAKMCTNAGEPGRRERRRTVMSPFKLILTLSFLTLSSSFTVEIATAQNSAPKPGASEPAPMTGPASPSPLQPGDAFGEQVTLPDRTMVYLKGHSKWDTAFDTLVDSFKSLHEYLDKQNIKPAGPAFTIYTQTDDTGFSYEAALPITELPKDPPKGDIAVGPAPSGKAYKFVHRGSYDAMDTTYEAITNYLDDKQLEAKDLFIEEYATDPVKSDPDKLVVNVFVPVK